MAYLKNTITFFNNNFEEIIFGGTDGLISIYTLLFALNNINVNKLATIGILIFNILGAAFSMSISNYNSKIAIEGSNKEKIGWNCKAWDTTPLCWKISPFPTEAAFPFLCVK